MIKKMMLGLSGLISIQALAFDFERLAGVAARSVDTKMEYIHESSLDFDLDPVHLGSGNMQMAIQLMNADEFASSAYARLDSENLVKMSRDARSSSDDIFYVAKLAVLFKNVSPHFFTAENVSEQRYLDAAMKDSENSRVYPRDISEKEEGVKAAFLSRAAEQVLVKTVQDYFGVVTVKAFVNQYSYNLENDEHFFMTKDEAHQYANFSSLEPKPTQIHSSRADRRLMTEKCGTWGNRVYNLYYKVGEHTLMVSYKLVTFVRNDFSWVTWRMLKNNVVNNQLESTKVSLMRIRDHIRSIH
jgi:hypothetical protein